MVSSYCLSKIIASAWFPKMVSVVILSLNAAKASGNATSIVSFISPRALLLNDEEMKITPHSA